jgi:hypothetical protein
LQLKVARLQYSCGVGLILVLVLHTHPLCWSFRAIVILVLALQQDQNFSAGYELLAYIQQYYNIHLTVLNLLNYYNFDRLTYAIIARV